jgi:hypothetical protein
MIPFDLIREYRARTFRLIPRLRLKSQQQAIEFVTERGFVFFWPITGTLLPSLWAAVAGDRPVADEHDDPGHITWRWKDDLLGSRSWYYAKVLRKKATMISFDVVPYFYALSENYGSPEDDYLTLYEQGRLTQEAKLIYEALLNEGALDTVALRKATHMSSPASEGRFNKAISDLQADFKILPVGVTQAGAWRYAFAYDIVARHYPELPDLAHPIREDKAREKLAELYIRSVGAAQISDVKRLFGWKPAQAERAIESLVKAGTLCNNVRVEEKSGAFIALSELAGESPAGND